ncbi:MAG: hypothetical protein J6E46_04060 [Faecalicoccus sp.]|nr:hypothetical protein [Faecalicoccus sp.]
MKKGLKMIFSAFLTMFFVLGLAACSQSGGGASAEPTAYEVYVTNEAGDPVEGVKVQFCSDTECLMGDTDKDGIATFEKEAGTYTVHVYKAPEEYAKDKTEYEAPEKPGRINITLKAAE